MEKTKYFKVNAKKELQDIVKFNKLLKLYIKNNNVDIKNLKIVNCSPDYSSIFVQHVNHSLSELNDGELFPVINLEMPYPTSTYDFEDYLYNWKIEYYVENSKYIYLFLDSGCLRGKNFSMLQDVVENTSNNIFGTLYLQLNSVFIPNIFVEQFNFNTQGGLLFHWESLLNKNWNY